MRLCHTYERRQGFTLVEVVVASALILILLAGLFSLITYVGFVSASTETLNTAKNIADYTLEYLRARNATQQFHPTDCDMTKGFYSSPGVSSAGLPGIVDLTGEPLDINRFPLYPDGTKDVGGKATFSTMQGYVSLRDAVVTDPWAFDPWETNAVLKKYQVGGGVFKYQYFDMITKDPYAIRFGTADAGTSPASSVIHQFSSWGDYQSSKKDKPNGWDSAFRATIWGTSPDSDAHFTQDSSRQTACHSYSGYRVLIRLTAHSNDTSYKHVQYYNANVTVYWMVAGRERSYATSTTIATY